MKYLVVLRSAPSDEALHFFAARTLEALTGLGNEISSVFVTGAAAALCSRNFSEGSPQARVRDLWAQFAAKQGCKLLCCGRAFADLGLRQEDCAAQFTLSGNMELAMEFAQNAGALEF